MHFPEGVSVLTNLKIRNSFQKIKKKKCILKTLSYESHQKYLYIKKKKSWINQLKICKENTKLFFFKKKYSVDNDGWCIIFVCLLFGYFFFFFIYIKGRKINYSVVWFWNFCLFGEIFIFYLTKTLASLCIYLYFIL